MNIFWPTQAMVHLTMAWIEDVCMIIVCLHVCIKKLQIFLPTQVATYIPDITETAYIVACLC